MSNRICTRSGKLVDPFNLRPEDVDINDIAHALSRICRFGGHIDGHYSVAEHSVWMAKLCSNKRIALMHGATEAYVNDIASPIKRHSFLNGYRRLEKRVWAVVAERFRLPHELPEDVKEWDSKLCSHEASHLMPWGGWGFDHGLGRPSCLRPDTAKEFFLANFDDLFKENAN